MCQETQDHLSQAMHKKKDKLHKRGSLLITDTWLFIYKQI